MSFNKRKMEDRRRKAAEQEAAARGVTLTARGRPNARPFSSHAGCGYNKSLLRPLRPQAPQGFGASFLPASQKPRPWATRGFPDRLLLAGKPSC